MNSDQNKKDNSAFSVKTVKFGGLSVDIESRNNQVSKLLPIQNNKTLKNHIPSSRNENYTEEMIIIKLKDSQINGMEKSDNVGSLQKSEISEKNIEQVELEDSEGSIELDEFNDLEKEINKFLSFGVLNEGKNISSTMRKLMMICRAVINNPKILLVYEETLNFGKGVRENLMILSNKLPNTAIICITRDSDHVLSYDMIFFIDAGRLIEKGSPTDLLNNPESYLYKFLNETEPANFIKLKYEMNENKRRIPREFSSGTGKVIKSDKNRGYSHSRPMESFRLTSEYRSIEGSVFNKDNKMNDNSLGFGGKKGQIKMTRNKMEEEDDRFSGKDLDSVPQEDEVFEKKGNGMQKRSTNKTRKGLVDFSILFRALLPKSMKKLKSDAQPKPLIAKSSIFSKQNSSKIKMMKKTSLLLDRKKTCENNGLVLPDSRPLKNPHLNSVNLNRITKVKPNELV